MSNSSFTEVSEQSWFSRLGNAFKGILVGLLLFILSFPIIIFNENRAVNTTVGLKQAQGLVLTVPAVPVSADNDGKLVHFTATATTKDILKDAEFGIELNAIRLARSVKMYQWQEQSESKTEKKLGGGTETVTKYSYHLTWSAKLIDSNNFKDQTDHSNPGSIRYPGRDITAAVITAGDYNLPVILVEQLNNWQPVDIGSDLDVPAGLVQHGSELISGNPDKPQVGDLRISYSAILPGPVSVVAQQVNQSLEAFHTKTGTSIAMLESGTLSSENMFKQAHANNSVLTWGLRLLALILMGVGIALVLNPLKVLADVIPFLGTVVGVGTGAIATLLALALTTITIAITWIAVRPILGVILLIVAGGAFYGIRFLARKNLPVEPTVLAQAAGT
ncbi:MAG: TMEM43 family protein [Halioglobus sp.]